jgi:hypothetical protein
MMRTQSNLRTFVLLLCLGTVLPASAAAQQGASTTPAGQGDAAAQAAASFDVGMELFNEQNWSGALDAFELAYSLNPNYIVLFNIGACMRELQRYPEALDAFQRYLSEGGANVRPEKRAQAEEAIAGLAPFLSHVRMVTSVDGAEILVNDQVRGTSPLAEPLVLGAGHYVIVARADGFHDAREEFDAVGGQDSEVELTLESLETAAPVPPPPSAAEPEPWYNDWAGWTSAGVGVVAVGVGSYFLWAASDNETKRDAAPNLADAHDFDDDAQTDWVVGGILVGVGGAALITGAILLAITDDEVPPSADTEVAPGVALVPFVGPNGLGIAGTF